MQRVLLSAFLAVLVAACGAKDDPYLDRQQIDLAVDGSVITTSRALTPYALYFIKFSSPHDLARTFRYTKSLGFLQGSVTLWHFDLDGAEWLAGYTEDGSDRLINNVIFKARGTGQPLKIRTSKDLTAKFAAPTILVVVFRSRWWHTDDGTSVYPFICAVLGLVGLLLVCGLLSSLAGPATYDAPVRVTPAPQPNPLNQRLLSWVTQHERWLLDHENLPEPSYQKNLLWRHRRAYHSAMGHWKPGNHALQLPPYPMSIPIAEWRTICDALNDHDLCAYLTAREPRLLQILKAMDYLCHEAEKVVIRPSAANDHLAVMDAQLEQINSINSRVQEMQEKIRTDPRLSDEEKKEQIEWIESIQKQRIQALLQEDSHGTSKDEVISPE